MAWDEVSLLQARQLEAPILRFYSWSEPSMSFGYFQKFAEVNEFAPNLVKVRRFTGGGIVSHLNDWTYSLVLPPNTDWYRYRAKESYRKLHTWIRNTFATFQIETALNPQKIHEGPGRCFIGAEEDDVIVDGTKLAGAAQRRNKTGFLIQGSIQPPPPSIVRSEWETRLCEVATRDWGVQWKGWQAAPDLTAQASALATAKYADTGYTQRR